MKLLATTARALAAQLDLLEERLMVGISLAVLGQLCRAAQLVPSAPAAVARKRRRARPAAKVSPPVVPAKARARRPRGDRPPPSKVTPPPSGRNSKASRMTPPGDLQQGAPLTPPPAARDASAAVLQVIPAATPGGPAQAASPAEAPITPKRRSWSEANNALARTREAAPDPADVEADEDEGIAPAVQTSGQSAPRERYVHRSQTPAERRAHLNRLAAQRKEDGSGLLRCKLPDADHARGVTCGWLGPASKGTQHLWEVHRLAVSAERAEYGGGAASLDEYFTRAGGVEARST